MTPAPADAQPDIVTAQHEETGRMWTGARDALPPRYNIVIGAPAPADAQPNLADAAEMLWVVLANVSGGDWTKQSPEWQEAAARWRDYYMRVAHPPADTQPVAWRAEVFGRSRYVFIAETRDEAMQRATYSTHCAAESVTITPLYAHPSPPKAQGDAAPAQDAGELRRYDYGSGTRLEPSTDYGEWVRYADAAALITRLRAALADAEREWEVQADLTKQLDEQLTAANARADANAKALADANSMCRSAYQVCNAIATQVGTVVCDRRIGALADRLHESLERQRAVMYPDAAKGTTP